MFDSRLNPYGKVDYLSGRSVPEVIEQLKQIQVPVKVLSWVSHANKVYAIIQTDIKIVKNKKKSEVKDGGIS